MKKTKWMLVLLVVLLGLCLVACGDDDDDDDYSSSKKKKKEPTETVEEVTPTETVTGYPAQNPDYDGPGSDGDVTATPTPEATPTEEVTPEPTPEVKKDYDPEIVFESNKDEYRPVLYRLFGEYFGERRIGIRRDTCVSFDDYDLWDAEFWKAFCKEHNLYCDDYLVDHGALLHPIPWQEETMYFDSPMSDPNLYTGFNWVFPSLCVVFVKEDEEFNLNDLLVKAREEYGADYTLDEMITSEYGNIICWSGTDETLKPTFDTEYTVIQKHKINIKEIFPEEGLYKAYVYRYYVEDQEWHRVDNDYVNRIKYNVYDYNNLGLELTK